MKVTVDVDEKTIQKIAAIVQPTQPPAPVVIASPPPAPLPFQYDTVYSTPKGGHMKITSGGFHYEPPGGRSITFGNIPSEHRDNPIPWVLGRQEK